MGENNEDMLDIFACVALMGINSYEGKLGKFASDVDHDARSIACYRQAASMLRVRKQYIDQGEPSNE